MKLIKLNMGERYRSSNDTDSHKINIELELHFEDAAEANEINTKLVALLNDVMNKVTN